MKRWTTLVLSFALSIAIWGQNCTPDQSITKPGIYPRSLDTAWVDDAYSFTIHVLAPEDTSIIFNGQPQVANIDSVVLNGVGGLPGDFTYACEPSNCVFIYTAVGCVALTGNPTTSDIGVHPLEIYTTGYARLNTFKVPVKDTIRDYTLVIRDSGSASVYELRFDAVNIYPNPAIDGVFYVETQSDVESIEVFDIQGRAQGVSSVREHRGHRIEMTGQARGVYFVHIRMNDRLIKRRIMF